MSERVKIILDKNADILRLPAIALRGLVVFPGNIIHFEVGRKKSIAAIEWAMSNNNAVFLTAQQDMDVEDPGFKDLYAYGVVAEVKQVLRVSDELVKVLVEGKYRAKLLTLDSSGRFLLASTKAAALRGTKSVDSARMEALVRSVKEVFEEYLSLNPRLSKDVVYTIITNEDAALLCDYIPANLLLKYTDKQALLNEGTVSGRLEKLLDFLRHRIVIDRKKADDLFQQCDVFQIIYRHIRILQKIHQRSRARVPLVDVMLGQQGAAVGVSGDVADFLQIKGDGGIGNIFILLDNILADYRRCHFQNVSHNSRFPSFCICQRIPLRISPSR